MTRLSLLQTIAAILSQLGLVTAALIVLLGAAMIFRRRLGILGHTMTSPVGLIGLMLVLFWVLVGLMAPGLVVQDPLLQITDMKNALPGSRLTLPDGTTVTYLLGGDVLGRDVFSRALAGAREVLMIAPPAAALAYMVGIALGLPAGYFGGAFDAVVGFFANALLSFPVILLFFLLVSPEVRDSAIPAGIAAVLFVLPTFFLLAAVNSRLFVAPTRRNWVLGLLLAFMAWLVAGVVFDADPLGMVSLDPNILNVFVAVAFINAPTVFRIVRGAAMDLRARDYVQAALTRGEGPWYIMCWEILPNARGPLIVDFCLRIGYTTILLGALGFFGLAVSPESPDWGSTISEGRKLMAIFPHIALAPALCLVSFVLGLNLLANALREESLRD
ncbi:ABC transporter permease [Tabrizicola sp. J26]|uniref:ABC transporter permease n=1 Tax=Alitabrizicola rongguiensis TaxID=2909234 RepID=UPI001F285D5D|nr:ABC transporter permease [Tabrizicola rongguiensis]MCF1710369.1 ABC transporter permease [Tabrizicola rongguiensis]